MKKLISMLVLTCLLFGTAFAEIWYPFGLTVEDDFMSAKTKVAEALADQDVDNSRFSSLRVNTYSYYLYDIPISQVIVNRPSGTEWRVLVSSDEMLKLSDNEANVYKLYKELVAKLGEPIEFSPVIKKITFDGVVEESIFKDEETFLAELEKAQENDDIIAKFENCEMFIRSTGGMYMSVDLYFER